MKKYRYILLLCILPLALAHTKPGLWSNLVNISNYQGTSWLKDLAIGSDNVFHIVWDDSRNWGGSPAADIFYSSFTGGFWSPPLQISPACSVCAYPLGPRIALDSRNCPHVIWVDHYMTSSFLFYSWKSDSGWTAPVDLTGGIGGASYPDLAIDTSDRIHAVWRMGYYNLYYCQWDGEEWSAPVSLFPPAWATTPRLAADRRGGVHLVWSGGPLTSYYNDIWYSRYDAESWSDPVNISNIPNYSSTAPQVAVDTAGNPHVVWEQIAADGSQDILYVHFDGVSWSAPLNLSGVPPNWRCYHPSISLSSRGECAVAYRLSIPSAPVAKSLFTIYDTNIWSIPDTIPLPSTSNVDFQYDALDHLQAVSDTYQSGVNSDILHFCYFADDLLSSTLTPQAAPITIPAGGGGFSYDLRLENHAVLSVTFDTWIEAVLPTGMVYGPLLQRQNLTLPAGASCFRPNLNQTVPGGAPPGQYWYRLSAGDYSDTLIISTSYFTFVKEGAGFGSGDWGVVNWEEAQDGAKDAVEIPLHVGFTVHPNPCNPTAVLRFDLPQAARTSLEVFDIRGRKVQTVGFSESDLRAGLHEVPFDGTDLPSGIYLVKLQAGEFASVQKIVLLK